MGGMISCNDHRCTTPRGKYIARMCALRRGSTMPTCVDLPFEYPTSATIEGVIM